MVGNKFCALAQGYGQIEGNIKLGYYASKSSQNACEIFRKLPEVGIK